MFKVINLFGGPGTGKSATAADIFSGMKRKHISVELTVEFAKTLVYEESIAAMADQLYIVGNQNRQLTRLMGKVDYVITDSPILMNLAYTPNYYLSGTYAPMIEELWNSYSNINIFLNRNKQVKYQPGGRTQNEIEAVKKDKEIKKLLDDRNIPYYTVDIGPNTSEQILKILF